MRSSLTRKLLKNRLGMTVNKAREKLLCVAENERISEYLNLRI